jgi:hypothetical protein
MKMTIIFIKRPLHPYIDLHRLYSQLGYFGVGQR